MTIYNMTLSTTEPYNNVGAVTVRQDDNLTQTFVANIVENGVKKTGLAGYQVFFNAMFDDNIIARDLAQFDYGKSIATYTLKDSFFQQTGEVEAYFSFEKDGKRDSTANFSYYVTAGNCRNVRQGNYIYELEELLSVSDDIIKNKDFTVLLEENRKLNAKLEEVKSGFNTKLEDINNNLEKHKIRVDNPHGVTASQVGAYTKQEADNKTNKVKQDLIVRKKRIFDSEEGKYFNASMALKYNLASNQELVKIKIIFSRFDPVEQQTFGFGYNSFTFDAEDFRGGPHWLGMAYTDGTVGVKSVYVTSSELRGHLHNESDYESRRWVLRRVTVYYTEN